jgi:hypothetical protein
MKYTKRVLLLLFIAIMVLGAMNARDNLRFLSHDSSGYYLYLPAVFIYHDWERLDFYSKIDENYQPAGDHKEFGIYRQSEGKRLNKYPPGVAIGELPLFLMADLFVQYRNTYPRDGYSAPYQLSVAISNMLWGILGLWALAAFLRKYFSDAQTAISVFLIGAGTNLGVYLLLDRGMSHSLVFMQTSLVLLLCYNWHRNQKPWTMLGLGLMLGWAIITRPTSIVLLAIPVFWPDPEKWRLLKVQWQQLLLGLAGILFMTGILFCYWKATTGNWLYFSYQEEGFNFKDPHIMDGLFSYQKGWFVYTPLALFGIAGLLSLRAEHRTLRYLFLLLLVTMIYVVFSWHDWVYGWGFGARPMIDFLPLVAFGLASLIRNINRTTRWIQVTAGAIALLLVLLNIFQSTQYKYYVLQGKRVTKEYYWRVWMHMSASDEDRTYLE